MYTFRKWKILLQDKLNWNVMKMGKRLVHHVSPSLMVWLFFVEREEEMGQTKKKVFISGTERNFFHSINKELWISCFVDSAWSFPLFRFHHKDTYLLFIVDTYALYIVSDHWIMNFSFFFSFRFVACLYVFVSSSIWNDAHKCM